MRLIKIKQPKYNVGDKVFIIVFNEIRKYFLATEATISSFLLEQEWAWFEDYPEEVYIYCMKGLLDEYEEGTFFDTMTEAIEYAKSANLKHFNKKTYEILDTKSDEFIVGKYAVKTRFEQWLREHGKLQ